MLKIYTVTFNDGGWHSGGLPSYHVVAGSSNEAKEMVLSEHAYYRKGYDCGATEFKIDGYVIEVYDEKSYSRDKKIENIDSNI